MLIYRGVTYNGRSEVMFLFPFHPPTPPPAPRPPTPISLECSPFCDCQVGSVLTACILYLLMTGDDMLIDMKGSFPEDLSHASQGITFPQIVRVSSVPFRVEHR